MKKSLLFLLMAGLLLLTSCNTPPSALYAWNNYEKTSYRFYKLQTPKAKADLMKTYRQMIEKPAGLRKAVPPGIHAEYGYLLMLDGKKEEGIKLLKTEMELYPESALFINQLLKRIEKKEEEKK